MEGNLLMGREEGLPEVELALDPYQGLPVAVSRALEQSLLLPEFECGTARLEAMEFLIEQWDELDGEEQVAKWAARHAYRDLLLERREDGVLIEGTARGERGLEVSSDLLSILISEVLKQPAEVRLARSESIRDLLGEWTAHYVDEEKILGHLLRHHSAGFATIDMSHDELISLHSAMHAR